MPNTMTLISAQTVGAGGASSITFSSIPQTYTDLLVKFSLRDDTASYAQNVKIVINGNTSSVYSERLLYGYGTATASANQNTSGFTSYSYMPSSTATANTFSNGEFYFPNYTSSSNKSYLVDSVTENNAANAFNAMDSCLFSSSSPITSFALSSEAAGKTLQQYSTVYLYGIKNS